MTSKSMKKIQRLKRIYQKLNHHLRIIMRNDPIPFSSNQILTKLDNLWRKSSDSLEVSLYASLDQLFTNLPILSLFFWHLILGFDWVLTFSDTQEHRTSQETDEVILFGYKLILSKRKTKVRKQGFG